MTALTRGKIPWNSGAMLGWNSSRKMDGIMRHFSNNANITEEGGTQLKSSRKSRIRSPYLEPQKDFSPEFIEYLRSFNKRDFEHAVVEGEDLNNNLMKSMTNDAIEYLSSTLDATTKHVDASANSMASKSKDTTKKHNVQNTNTLHGFNSFASTPSEGTSSRPSTVPRYTPHREKTRKGDLKRIFLRPDATLPLSRLSANRGPSKDVEENSSSVRPLVKTKVTPSQIDNESNELNPVDYCNGGDESVEPASYCSSGTVTLPDSERPSSAVSSSGSKRVTFAANVVNYERENKPTKKKKIPKRRRQGFPHPSRGIFVPPELEIVESLGPTGTCKVNPYLNFNQVWTHPAARSSGESDASRVVRQERFHRIMNDLEQAHVHYNRLVSVEQNDYLINSIFKRYILVLDLALTEGHLTQVEHLLDTIAKSIPVLQQNTFYYLYGPKIIKDMDQTQNHSKKPEEDPDSMLIKYALSRIAGKSSRHEVTNMSIETVLVKLCLELIELVFSQYGSLEFRSALTTVPYTVRQAIVLLKELRTNKDVFCYVKWINNSAAQRDYRSIMKNLGLLDRYGCKAENLSPPLPNSTQSEGFSSKIKTKPAVPRNSVTKRPKTPPLPKPSPEMTQTRPPSRTSTS